MNCLPDTDQVTWAIFVPLLWLNWQCSTLDNFLRIKKVNLAISQILIFYVVIPVWLRACLAHGISLFTALHIFLEILKEIKRLQNLTLWVWCSINYTKVHLWIGEGQQWTNSIFARRFADKSVLTANTPAWFQKWLTSHQECLSSEFKFPANTSVDWLMHT